MPQNSEGSKDEKLSTCRSDIYAWLGINAFKNTEYQDEAAIAETA